MAEKNRLQMVFPGISENVAIARVAAAAFAAQLDLTLSDIEEIKVAVSEAVTNAIIHAYPDQSGRVELAMALYDDRLVFMVTDHGCGIADIDQARQPSFSTAPERMGLGFVFMESFMDELTVESTVGKGTVVRMVKKVDISPAH